MGFDFRTFWEAARALLSGISPYTIHDFISPLPFAWLMAPFGLLPYAWAYGLWTLLNLAALVRLAGRRAPQLLLFLPVLFALWVGQVDLLMLAAGLTGGWVGLAFTTLKPQLAIWLIPWVGYGWWRSGQRRKLLYTLGGAAVLYGLPYLVQPQAWQQWRIASNASGSLVGYAEHSASFFGLAALLPISPTLSVALIAAVGAAAALWLRPLQAQRFWPFMALFNPISNIYSQCVLHPLVDWPAVLLSWLMLPLSLYLHTGLPWVVVPLYLLWKNRKTAANPPG